MPSQTDFADELAALDGRTCPGRLPRADEPDPYGFGNEAFADARPALASADRAWICRYNPLDVAPEGRNGAFFRWVLRGDPHAVAQARLTAITDGLAGLALKKPEVFCTDDLGSRWLLVYSHQGDLTGVAFDDYGCGDVHLTDNPFTTAPGDAEPIGTVPGSLTAPAGLLDEIKAAYRIG